MDSEMNMARDIDNKIKKYKTDDNTSTKIYSNKERNKKAGPNLSFDDLEMEQQINEDDDDLLGEELIVNSRKKV